MQLFYGDNILKPGSSSQSSDIYFRHESAIVIHDNGRLQAFMVVGDLEIISFKNDSRRFGIYYFHSCILHDIQTPGDHFQNASSRTDFLSFHTEYYNACLQALGAEA
jgi:hypothetical protein